MREEIDTALYEMSKDLGKRLFEDFYPLARDDEEMKEIREKAESYFRTAVISPYYRYKAKKFLDKKKEE